MDSISVSFGGGGEHGHKKKFCGSKLEAEKERDKGWVSGELCKCIPSTWMWNVNNDLMVVWLIHISCFLS